MGLEQHGCPPGAGRTVARLAKALERALGPLDLSLPQYRVLALLGDGSTAASVLARQLAVSPPSVTALIDGLVARGLVERESDPEDRRRLTLLLTKAGRRALIDADAAAEARLAEIAGYLDDDEHEQEQVAASLAGWGRALDRSREERVSKGDPVKEAVRR